MALELGVNGFLVLTGGMIPNEFRRASRGIAYGQNGMAVVINDDFNLMREYLSFVNEYALVKRVVDSPACFHFPNCLGHRVHPALLSLVPCCSPFSFITA